MSKHLLIKILSVKQRVPLRQHKCKWCKRRMGYHKHDDLACPIGRGDSHHYSENDVFWNDKIAKTYEFELLVERLKG